MKIFWTKLALDDFDSEMFFIFQNNQAASKNISRKILKDLNYLEEFPFLWRIWRVKWTRELIVSSTPFIIPYRINWDFIEIIRVFNSARNWPNNF